MVKVGFTVEETTPVVNDVKNIEAEDQQLPISEKNFDKIKVFKNIRTLLKKKGIKLGQIEREAGVQPGYMSRLEKPDSNSDPSIEFIVTAGRELEVSLDQLIYGEFNEITATEEYILKFFKYIIKDTKEDELVWRRHTEKMLKNLEVYDEDPGSTSHPLFRYGSQFDGDEQKYIKDIYYKSEFSTGEDTVIAGNCYDADMGNATSIYLMKCKTKDTLPFYEVYLINEYNTISPICSSLNACTKLGDAMDTLYREVEDSTKRIHLDNNAKTAIEEYLGLKELPFI